MVFQPMYRYFKKIVNIDNMSEWKSKGLSNEIIKTRDNTIAPELIYSGKTMYVKFNESCLKQNKITFNYGKVANMYIAHALKSILNYDEDITLENCLFGGFKMTKNDDVRNYKYSGYVIGFDGKGAFS